jgi:hypothetical protein
VDHFTFPNTDSPEVMQAAVSAWITSLIWKQVSRGVHDDDAEEMLVGVYARIYKAVKTAHDGG